MKRWVGLWALAFALMAAVGGHGPGVIGGALIGALLGWALRGTLRAEVEAEVARQLARRGLQPAAAAAAKAAAPAAEPAATDAELQPDERVPAAATAPSPVPVTQPAIAAGMTSAQALAMPQAPAAPGAIDRALAAAKAWLLGGNSVVRAGIVVLFIGLAFLAKWAADHALFPPELRLVAIGAAGIALLVTGFRLRQRSAGYAHSLQGAGVAVLYLTVFAAFRLGFVATLPAFVLLALICALSAAIALLQATRALAFIGFAGAFAAPLLVSSGAGNAVALFSYYLLLGVALASIAWLRAWRELNLLGFFATFAVATAWGVLRFQPADQATAQAFLIAFFAVYFAATLFYALRHGLAARQAVDGTLVFGLPIIAFGLQAALVREQAYAQAFSALVLGGFYLLMAMLLLRRGEVGRWLAECFTVLGLAFVTLAVPLALDATWTAAVWAVEGAAVYWLAQRQQRTLARLIGLVLQGLAAFAFLVSLDRAPEPRWMLANAAFVGSAMLAASAWAVAWWSRATPAAAEAAGDAPQPWIDRLSQGLSPLLFWLGVLWWVTGWVRELDAQTWPLEPLGSWHVLLVVLLATSSAWRAIGERRQWSIALTPMWFNVPLLLAMAVVGIGLAAIADVHPLAQFGWLAWPLAWALHLHALRRQDGGAPARWWRWSHAGHVWWTTLFVGALLVHAIGRAELWATAWATVILQVAGTAVLLALCTPPFWRPRRWPLDRYAASYTWLGAAPLAVLVLAGSVGIAIGSRGNAHPLPYLPLLNPTDLSVALSLAALAAWLLRHRDGSACGWSWLRGRQPWLLLAVAGFVAINTVWLRIAHHVGGVAWDAGALFDSFLVQTGYSILWTVLALAAMWAAHRRARQRPQQAAEQRGLWMTGAVLLGVTVAKLLLVDQQNAGGGERIVAFVAVGVLMLVIGYLAPLPPKHNPA